MLEDILERRKRKLEDYYKHKEKYNRRSKLWYQNNKEKAAMYSRKWDSEHREHVRKRERNYNARIKHMALEAYCDGDVECLCCGENHKIMLSIDHINRDGAAHRRIIGRGSDRLYAWLKKNNYPPGFRVLCINCNMTLGMTGSCPHSNLTQ